MRTEKTAIVDEVKGCLQEADYALLVDYQGLTVEAISDLRTRMDEHRSRVIVVKNSFLKHAMEEKAVTELDDILKGPTAVITGNGDITQVAKALAQFVKENEVLDVKGGTLGPDRLSASDIDVMAKIPPREVLLGGLVGTVAAPMTGLAGVLKQKLSTLMYVLKAVEEKKSNA